MVMAVSLISLARSAAAEEGSESIPDHPVLSDAWYLSAGALWAESNVTANLNSGAIGAGALIDFEDDMGLDENSIIGLFDARWHFTKRWQLEVEYFKLDRDNEKQVQRVVDWGDVNVPIDGVAKGTFNIEDFRVSVGYSFFRTKDKEVGVGLGAHVAKLEAGLSTRNFGSDFASQTAPLPFLTLYARMALTDRWLLSMRVDRLSLDTGDIDGKVFSSGLDVIYQPWRHFSIGLGFRDINFQVSSTSDDWRGKAQIQQSGPALYFATSF
ncbi:hypothetical protein GCM10011487_25940 [Steroidobacter agaridevorans]|uniref:Outer membrane protein beta-barrel domain-containing protein n=3 Tax=Steroidobacter agaridevorans TaxID=2695856 RepID=A0A829YB47_9GAMM|nr:hypothetical protein GCM10011487_25940 [Steroidobacter agaridevorans]GFE87649.1 hypothetical protein GCM10011488_26030 [Steroidobacter agaridevorans]